MKAGWVLILGANSDVAKACIPLYLASGYKVVAASRNIHSLKETAAKKGWNPGQVHICYFDACDFGSHQAFYESLPCKPEIVLYAAGYLVTNEGAFDEWQEAKKMMDVHYAGAVSILNLIHRDAANPNLRQIIGLSTLAGVRGRKSNFVYGSSKAAFAQYLTGLRQWLASRGVRVNVVVAGYIRSKMTAGLNLPESLMLEPSFVADAVVNAGKKRVIIPGWKWKIIYLILKILPERIVAKLP